MEHPYGEQYCQEGNPRAYMTMRDYRNLPYQWQQPVGRNPNPPRSMREYRDQWMSAPVYNVPSTYPPPPHPQYASLSQPQPSQPISLVEQAILDLTKLVGDAVVEQKEFNAQLSEKIHTEENSLDQRLDGLNNDFEHEWDNLQDSIEDLIEQQQCPPEEESQEDECLTETILGEQIQLQPQEELKMESVEAPEELQDTSKSGDTFWPWKKEEQTSALISEKDGQEEECLSDTMVEEQCQQHLLLEPSDIAATVCPLENHTSLLTGEGSGKEEGEEPQKLIFYLNPIDLDPNAIAQPKNNPLPVAPSDDQVYILPTPAEKSKPAAPAPKGKSNRSLHAMQNLRKLVAIAQAFATTLKKMETAYTAWHSGWFGCGFGFGAPGPRHF